MRTERKGLLVTLDGADGAGKSTLAKGLVQALQAQGHPVLLTRQPGGTALGVQIRQLVLGASEGQAIAPLAELLLFAADRAQHAQELIRPALARGAIVICDRWHLSTWAYQHLGRGLPLATVVDACLLAADGLEADASLILRCSPATLAERRAARGQAVDRMESAGNGFHARIADAYLVAGSIGPASLFGHKLITVDAEANPAGVLASALTQLQPVLEGLG